MAAKRPSFFEKTNQININWRIDVQQKKYEEAAYNLASDDGNGRKGVPESGQSALLAMIAKSSASSLKFVDQGNEILHERVKNSD